MCDLQNTVWVFCQHNKLKLPPCSLNPFNSMTATCVYIFIMNICCDRKTHICEKMKAAGNCACPLNMNSSEHVEQMNPNIIPFVSSVTYLTTKESIRNLLFIIQSNCAAFAVQKLLFQTIQ